MNFIISKLYFSRSIIIIYTFDALLGKFYVQYASKNEGFFFQKTWFFQKDYFYDKIVLINEEKTVLKKKSS